MCLTFSVVIICKNGERVIRRCLEAILFDKKECDEIIVINTGSDDRTINIINSIGGVNLYEYKWTDDFAAARNFGISKASKDWIFFIDSDEVLKKGSLETLREKINEIKKYSNAEEEIVFSPKVKNTDDSIVYNAGRIIENNDNVLFEGCIHEYPISLNSKKNLVTLKLSGVMVVHDGYEQSVQNDKHKAERNNRLIKAVLSEQPTNSRYYYFYYRDSKPLISGEEFEKGMEDFFVKFPDDSYNNQVSKDLAIHYIQMQKYDKAEEHIKYLFKSAKRGNTADRSLASLLLGINEIEKIKKKQMEVLKLLELTKENLNRYPEDSLFDQGYQFDDLIAYLLFQLEDFEGAFSRYKDLFDKGYTEHIFRIFNKIDQLKKEQKTHL